jgi:uncharacterized RmlC-like cupin family protein
MEKQEEILREKAIKVKDARPVLWRRAVVGSTGAVAVAGATVGAIAVVGGVLGIGSGAIGYSFESKDYNTCYERYVAAEVCVWYEEDVTEAAEKLSEDTYYNAYDYHHDEIERYKGVMEYSAFWVAAGGFVIAGMAKFSSIVARRTKSGQQVSEYKAAQRDMYSPVQYPDPSDPAGIEIIEYRPSRDDVQQAWDAQ